MAGDKRKACRTAADAHGAVCWARVVLLPFLHSRPPLPFGRCCARAPGVMAGKPSVFQRGQRVGSIDWLRSRTTTYTVPGFAWSQENGSAPTGCRAAVAGIVVPHPDLPVALPRLPGPPRLSQRDGGEVPRCRTPAGTGGHSAPTARLARRRADDDAPARRIHDGAGADTIIRKNPLRARGPQGSRQGGRPSRQSAGSAGSHQE